MLITVCYSLLTWLQHRKRAEVIAWIEETCFRDGHSVLLLKDRLETPVFQSSEFQVLGSLTSSPSSTLTRDIWKGTSTHCVSETQSLSSLRQPQTSPHCFNRDIRSIRLLSEAKDTRTLAISPYQIVELHDWTAFVDPPSLPSSSVPSEDKIKSRLLHLLIEAEPGLSADKSSYRKFWKFGEIVAWKCDTEFALILQSEFEKVVQFMNIFRLCELILEGGWRVYRVTTIHLEGNAGTLISRNGIENYTQISPAELRRLSAGIYAWTVCEGTPKSSPNVTNTETPKHNNILLISEDSLDHSESEDRVEVSVPLPNWHERSPKKRSIATIHNFEKPVLPPRRKSSITSLSHKSSSLASLIFCSNKSISCEENSGGRSSPKNRSATHSPLQTPDREKPIRAVHSATPTKSTRISLEILNNSDEKIQTVGKNMSASTSDLDKGVMSSGLSVRSLGRAGKPPNILILCPDEKIRQSIASILKTMTASDRYVIYEIRWDQLRVGGWAEQTALLVISGTIPDPTIHVPILLQFLGDGGKLFAWCSESPPFGIPKPERSRRGSVVYSSTQTQALTFEESWGTAKDLNSAPHNFPRILETNDSEGISRPLTASVYAKSKDMSQAIVLLLDGGVLGGKAILSQVHFEESMDDETSQAMLSNILSGALGLDCRRIKTPVYSIGYLLGDHLVIQDFLTQFPSKIEQSELRIEFVSRGEKGPTPTHQLFPIHYFECPKNFSTLHFFENLESRELGRLLVYGDVMGSVMNVLDGRPLKHGLTVIARQQTAGRGRGKNVWLSPEGSALFAFQLHLNWDCGIGRRISLLQHLSALAIILAVPQHKEIQFRVKWPNDVYMGTEKIGGILVESTMEGKRFVVNVGIGINVSNAYPTTSLNVGLEKLPGFSKSLLLCPEIVIARTLTQLERLIDSVTDEKGLEHTLSLYIENWIHRGDEEVNVEIAEGKFASCRIRNIDEFGFLRVTEISTGNTFSVQPDGNSFDIANRLISIKH